jgi:hypothetical protein
MFMDVAAPGLNFGLQVGRAVDDGHGKLGFKCSINALSSTPVALGPIALAHIDKSAMAGLWSGLLTSD